MRVRPEVSRPARGIGFFRAPTRPRAFASPPGQPLACAPGGRPPPRPRRRAWRGPPRPRARLCSPRVAAAFAPARVATAPRPPAHRYGSSPSVTVARNVGGRRARGLLLERVAHRQQLRLRRAACRGTPARPAARGSAPSAPSGSASPGHRAPPRSCRRRSSSPRDGVRRPGRAHRRGHHRVEPVRRPTSPPSPSSHASRRAAARAVTYAGASSPSFACACSNTLLPEPRHHRARVLAVPRDQPRERRHRRARVAQVALDPVLELMTAAPRTRARPTAPGRQSRPDRSPRPRPRAAAPARASDDRVEPRVVAHRLAQHPDPLALQRPRIEPRGVVDRTCSFGHPVQQDRARPRTVRAIGPAVSWRGRDRDDPRAADRGPPSA